MRLLLDTCTFLWLTDRTDLLSQTARRALEDGSNDLFLHQVSSLETQLKYALGKLPLKLPPHQFIPLALSRHRITYEKLVDETIWFLDKLPFLHYDPFDRLITAHALRSGMTIVTPDPNIQKYPVPVLW